MTVPVKECMQAFICVISGPKLHERLHSCVVMFRKACRAIQISGKQRAEIRQPKLQKNQKWHHMGLSMQRELRANFGQEKVMALQLFNVNREQNIEISHQCTMPLIRGRWPSSAGIAIRLWVRVDSYRSVMKRKK